MKGARRRTRLPRARQADDQRADGGTESKVVELGFPRPLGVAPGLSGVVQLLLKGASARLRELENDRLGSSEGPADDSGRDGL